jgi:hypothetical protein|tara:strand:+ start:27 stop:614 length:588 start_codon:yes stop_codon:yes gene_type:complete
MMGDLLQKLGDKAYLILIPADVRTETAQFIQILRKRAEVQLISPERKRELEGICLELRERYQTDGTFDFEAVFSDYNICYMEDERIFDPRTCGLKDGRYFMLLHPFGDQKYKDHIKAHELGHVVLNHQPDEEPKEGRIEQEANFFAGKLIGNYSIRSNAAWTMSLVLHELREHQQDFQRYSDDPDLYIARIIANS